MGDKEIVGLQGAGLTSRIEEGKEVWQWDEGS